MNREVPPSFNLMQRICLRITHYLPRSLIADTERIGLSIAFIFVGMTSMATIYDENSAFSSLYPTWVIVMWSITLFVGGVLTIIGMNWSLRLTERAGIMLAGIGCLSYGGTLLAYGSGRSKVVGVLFLILFLIKLIRLIVSTASSAYGTQQEVRKS
jgi:hypothetical protein